ncbi:MAG: aminopeptidase P family N-terminal domain-containing protein, partial [Candidatus Limnocylindrales bacterium]
MTAVAMPPRIPAERHAQRLARLGALVEENGLAAALIAVGPDLDYLTGYRAMPLERLTMLAVVAGQAPILVAPRLEEATARAGIRTNVEIATWMETDDPHALVAGLVERARGRASAT